MSKLESLLKTFKKNTETDGLLGELDRFLIKSCGGADIGRPYEVRDPLVHHPSSLSADECLRHMVYNWLCTPISDDRTDPKGQRIFDTGHDFGYRMQGYFWRMGILLGKWHCIYCGHKWLDMDNPSPRTCPNCGRTLEIWYSLHYLEVPLYDKSHNIGGRADAALVRKNGRKIAELKTIKNRDISTGQSAYTFDDLIQPLEHHRRQVAIYSSMANELYGKNSEDDWSSNLIIYGAKNNQNLKLFETKPLPEDINFMYTRAEMVDSCLEQGTLPNRVCESRSDRPCKYCDRQTYCWTEHTFEDADHRKKGGK